MYCTLPMTELSYRLCCSPVKNVNHPVVTASYNSLAVLSEKDMRRRGSTVVKSLWPTIFTDTFYIAVAIMVQIVRSCCIHHEVEMV